MFEEVMYRVIITFLVVILTPNKKDLSTNLFKGFNFEYKSKNRSFKVEYREDEKSDKDVE